MIAPLSERFWLLKSTLRQENLQATRPRAVPLPPRRGSGFVQSAATSIHSERFASFMTDCAFLTFAPVVRVGALRAPSLRASAFSVYRRSATEVTLLRNMKSRCWRAAGRVW